MRIDKFFGYEDQLYRWIGPVVMSAEAVRANGGRAFLNTDEHVWYVAVAGVGLVKGFLSVRRGRITNDFTWGDVEVLEQLLEAVLKDMPGGTEVTFLADASDRAMAERLGFVVQRQSANYYSMVKRV